MFKIGVLSTACSWTLKIRFTGLSLSTGTYCVVPRYRHLHTRTYIHACFLTVAFVILFVLLVCFSFFALF